MKILFSIFLFGCVCTGCLKQGKVLDYSSISPVVAIPNSNWPIQAFPAEDSVFDVALSSAQINLYANISFQAPLKSDLRVSFRVDTALVTAYNDKFGGGRGWEPYILLPDSAYRLPNLQITIPAGKQQAFLPITVYPHKMNNAQNYILGFTITNAGGYSIATNFNSVIYPLKAQ